MEKRTLVEYGVYTTMKMNLGIKWYEKLWQFIKRNIYFNGIR